MKGLPKAVHDTKHQRIYRTLLKIIVHKAVSVDALAQFLYEKRLVVRHRPARSEARVKKQAYPLMTKPRHESRKQLQTTETTNLTAFLSGIRV